jgi:hypothetical protein
MVAVGLVLIFLALGWWLFIPIAPGLALVLCLLQPILFIVGIIIFIVGLATSPPQPATVVQVQAPMPYPQMANTCPACGYPLTWIPQYRRNYCYKCRSYR